MKRKLILAFSMVALLTVLFAISVSAAEPVETWDVSATSNDNVTATLYSDYSLVISGTGNMKMSWAGRSAPWYYSYGANITSVIIENCVTNIGKYAFYGCENLINVVFGDNVTSIGEGAFYACKSLTSVVIPDSVTSISIWAFSSCDSLTSVVIPNSVTSIAEFAFYHSDSLTIYCEAKERPNGWSTSWNGSVCPVVSDYKNTLKNRIFQFKGYSFNESGSFAIGFDINYEAKAIYEELTGETLDIGVVFAGLENLAGKLPIDENGNSAILNVGKVIKKSLTDYSYTSYDFVLSDVSDDIKDVKLVIASYVYDGQSAKYEEGNGISDTVAGISYNQAKEDTRVSEEPENSWADKPSIPGGFPDEEA